MNTNTRNVMRFAGLVLLSASLASCGLPRSGPNKQDIFSGASVDDSNLHVVEVDDRIVQLTTPPSQTGFPKSFLQARVLGSDTIAPGDTLSLTIWENVDNGLLSDAGGAVALDQVQVDGDGMIFVPFAGEIKAAGHTPDQVRQMITENLASQTPDPQVTVNRLAGDGATVSVSGAVGQQGIFAIERPTRTLTAMLATAGGVAVAPEIALVTVFRGKTQATVWFQDIFAKPGYDIAMRSGDRILVEADARTYTALGATGTQRRVAFESQDLNAVQALAQVGGLSGYSADPTGIFVFRTEPDPVAQAVLQDQTGGLPGPKRIIYLLNLSNPQGIFLARDFIILDGDTLYVTEAPYLQWTKSLNAFIGSLNTANTFNTLAGN